MKILVANLGSTSLKYRLFEFRPDGSDVLAKGGFERVTDYPAAIDECLRSLKEQGAIAKESDLAAVGFKTVLARGVSGCVYLTEDVLRAMEDFSGLAPAHNPPYVSGIRLFSKRIPGVPLIGLFETAFYQWAPEAAMRYAVPPAWYQAGVRRWGFHGASHKFVAERSAFLLGRDDVSARARDLYVRGLETPVESPEFRVISCHLGGSSSVTGIRDGVAIGNSMGLSPQSGLPQNNRVGDLDAFALPFLMRSHGLTLDEAERLMCSEGGLKGLSGFNDLRDIMEAAGRGEEGARLAVDVLVHHVRHWIGAYFAQLNGLDALVFTAGIGENQHEIREAVCDGLDALGIRLDPLLNERTRACESVISSSGSKVRVLVIPANEELVVAREVHRLLTNQDPSDALLDRLEQATRPPGRAASE